MMQAVLRVAPGHIVFLAVVFFDRRKTKGRIIARSIRRRGGWRPDRECSRQGNFGTVNGKYATLNHAERMLSVKFANQLSEEDVALLPQLAFPDWRAGKYA